MEFKRFIKVKNGKIIDTSLLLPHVECYHVRFNADRGVNELFVEQIDGTEYYLGVVVDQANEHHELV